MKKLFKQKQKEQMDRTNAFCEFLVELTSACFGGKKGQDEVGLDSGEGIGDMTAEQLAQMKEMLGETDFNQLYGHLL